MRRGDNSSFEEANKPNTRNNYDADRRGNLSEFFKVGEKREGNEPGIIAQKRGEGIKRTKTLSSKKYEYKWMIKDQAIEDTLNDYLGTAVARFFVGDRAPKNKVIKNSSGKVLIASRMIEGFKTIKSDTRFEDPAKLNIWQSVTEKVDYISGVHEIKALHAFIGNYDDHASNDGSVPLSDTKRIAAMVDTGRSMGFKKSFAFHEWSSELNGKKRNEELEPLDLLRVRVGTDYQMPVDMFLNSEYVAALRAHHNKYMENKDAFNNMLRSAVDKLTSKIPYQELESYTIKVGNAYSLFESLKESFEKQAGKIAEHADHLELQMLFQANKFDALKELIRKNPKLLNTEIQFIQQGGELKKFKLSENLGNRKEEFQQIVEESEILNIHKKYLDDDKTIKPEEVRPKLIQKAAELNGITEDEIIEYARHLRTTSRIYNRSDGTIQKSQGGKIAWNPDEAHNQAMQLFDGLGGDDAADKSKKQLLVLAVGLEMQDQNSKKGFASIKQTVGNFFKALGNAFKSKEAKVTSTKVLEKLGMDRQELLPVIEDAKYPSDHGAGGRA